MMTTESEGQQRQLQEMSALELLTAMNEEDRSVPQAVAKAIPQITPLVEAMVTCLENGGRVFYVGAGTSGRLGVVDASELPPTFGVDFDLFVGLIAGGDGAIRKAVEFAEDDAEQAWKDLEAKGCKAGDFVVGIAASGRTPYVIGGLEACNSRGILTGCIVCNTGSGVAKASKFPVEVIVGPEFVTGSTRLKAGTAQKLVLNMISTTAMVRIGRVKGTRMVHMQLTNNKLVDRGTKMLMNELGLEEAEAARLLQKHGNVAKALEAVKIDPNPGA